MSRTKCPECSFENNGITGYCSNCGLKISAVPQENNRYNEVILFVDKNAEYYVTQFKKIEQRKSPAFNWAAFLFSYNWMFARKLRKEAVVLAAVMIGFLCVLQFVGGLLVYDANQKLDQFVYKSDLNNNSNSEYIVFEEEYNTFKSNLQNKMIAFYGAGFAAFLAICIAVGIKANKIYCNYVSRTLTEILMTVPSDQIAWFFLSERGGRSIMQGFLFGIGASVAPNIILILITIFT